VYSAGSRFASTTKYFENHKAVLCPGTSHRFILPGETAVACINEIHIHVQYADEAETLNAFNNINKRKEATLEGYITALECPMEGCTQSTTTMALFCAANNELCMNNEINRVGWYPHHLKDYGAYWESLASFRPIPYFTAPSRCLELEGTVYFWARLRNAAQPRIEFRPMDMGPDWINRVCHLFNSAKSGWAG